MSQAGIPRRRLSASSFIFLLLRHPHDCTRKVRVEGALVRGCMGWEGNVKVRHKGF